MTTLWDELAPTALGDRLADDLRQVVVAHEASRERTMQTDLGPSDCGDPCTYCLAAKILGVYEDAPFSDPWRSIVGSAVHAWLEDAVVGANIRNDDARWFPELRVQPDPVLLPSGGRCDLYDSHTRTVVDHKTKGSKAKITAIRNDGPPLGHRRQAHLYGLGYSRAGHTVEHVALAYWPRDGRLGDLYVHTEPYDELTALECLQRFDMLRDLCRVGVGVLDGLPSDAGCFVCSRKRTAA